MSKEEKISQWFFEYSDDIYQFLLYKLGSSDVEDLVQEVFIRALKSLKTFKGNSSPKTWLYSIARNMAIDEIRKRKREKWKSLLLLNNEQSTILSPEELYFLSEEHKVLIATIYSLKSNYQDVLILRGMKELTVEETANILGWTEEKVRSTHYRAKQALHAKLGGDSVE